MARASTAYVAAKYAGADEIAVPGSSVGTKLREVFLGYPYIGQVPQR